MDPIHVNTTRPLAPLRIEGWTLFEGDGSTWVRDLDLAERAGLTVPSDLRRTIDGAVRDGTIGVGGTNAHQALVHAVEEAVPMGTRGEAAHVTYYLNEDAALLVLMRLRPPRGVEAVRAVVRAFQVVRGEYVGAGARGVARRLATLELRTELDRQEIRLLRTKLDLVESSSAEPNHSNHDGARP
jgi:hypothetical protein